MKIADRIYNLRKSKGISQEQLADAVGISLKEVCGWENEQDIPDIEKVIILSDYFNVTTDYILKGIETQVENRGINFGKNLLIIATGLNFIGFIIMLFDVYFTWDVRVIAMTDGMVLSKIVSIIFMILGTTVFYLALNYLYNNKHENIRKFLMINVFPYSSIISMITYILLDRLRIWPMIIYVIVVFISEVVLLKTKSKVIAA